MKKGILIILAILFLAVGAWVVELLWSAGQFRTVTPHFSGRYRTVSGLIGVEDITIHPESGLAYLSACDRRAVASGNPGRGALYAYDLNAAVPELINLTPDADADFQPHGISLYVTASGPDALFVINHQGALNRIEIYDLENETLKLRQTLTDPSLVSPNDLAAIGPDQCYVTNDHRHVTGMARLIEEYGRRRLANAVFYDGKRFSEAVSGIGYANGINLSRDGRTLYLAATTERSLHVYDRNPDTNQLTLREKLPLQTGVDNIEIDQEGGLWIGAHPKLLSFVKHAQDPSLISPSQVLRLTFLAGGGYVVEEVFADRGEALSASSVAAVLGQRMLIGAVFDPKILDCHIIPHRETDNVIGYGYQ
jgi:arylesterase/paraoxonase